LLPPLAGAALQVATAVGPVVTVLQFVVVKPFEDEAAAAVHEVVGVCAVFVVEQVVAV
jgi:hypothetical protein